MTDVFEVALAAHRAGDFAAAERGYRRVMHLRNAAQNLGSLYAEHDRPEAAEKVFRWLLEHRPDYAPARHSLGMLLLAQRRYAEAWPLHEAGRRGTYSPVAPPQADFPEWTGQPLEGKRIVVCTEEGLGDQLMFGRYLAELGRRGADAVLACDPRTVARLYEAAGFRTAVLLPSHTQLPSADYWALTGSVPAHLDGGPPPAPVYLPRELTKGGGIGVVTRGNPALRNDANRSLPPDAAARLARLGRDLHPSASGARDLLETAEIVAGLDLVITVDTAVAHLAGAMGKACWVLLPRIGLDWRWNDGVHSDWYPDMRLLRQAPAGDWDSVLDAVEAAL
jgi:hypothetical protein